MASWFEDNATKSVVVIRYLSRALRGRSRLSTCKMGGQSNVPSFRRCSVPHTIESVQSILGLSKQSGKIGSIASLFNQVVYPSVLQQT